MAHANPEFALGLMRRDTIPVAQQIDRQAFTLKQLRDAMHQIEEIVRLLGVDALGQDELAAWRAWCAGKRYIRQRQAADRRCTLPPLIERDAGGMHAGGKAGELFVPPTVRGEGRKQRWAQS